MLAAVVVTYSQPVSVVQRCVTALASNGPVRLVVVVDTGDRSDLGLGLPPEAIAHVEHIRTANDGYGAAANIGWRRALGAGATRILLVNDDLVIETSAVQALLDELAADDDLGAVQPVLVLAGTKPQLINSLGVRVGADGAGFDIGDGEPLDTLTAEAHDIEMFTAGAVMFTDDFLRTTGGFDPRYFLYYEDVDLARRGAAAGYRYRLVPTALAVHQRSATTAGDVTIRFYQERNRLWATMLYGDAATIVRSMWLSIRRLRHQPRRIHTRALVAGLASAPRLLATRLAHSRSGLSK